MHKLIGPEPIWFEDLYTLFMQPLGIVVDLPEVCPRRPLRTRTNAVHPVVRVRKAAARPSNHRNLNFAEHFNQFQTNSETIWDLRVFSDPDAVVDHSADVLCKLPEKIGRNQAS